MFFPETEKEMVRVMLSESLKAVISQVSHINTSIQTGQQYGMQTMDQALLRLVKIGDITADAASAYALQKDLFVDL